MNSPVQTTDLLKTRRFLPLFVVQFLGAFNDNFYKQALIILVTYQLAATSSLSVTSLTALAGATLILPFMIFSAPAGRIADKFDKAKIIIIIKFCEILIMGLAGLALFSGSLYFLYAVLFLLGTQSAFFGPLKYATLPFHLKKNELVAGNSLIEAGTFLAILLGSSVGSVAILNENGATITLIGILVVAILGFLFAFKIPSAPSVYPDTKITLNIIRDSWTIIRKSCSQRSVCHALFALCWFWAISSIVLSILPAISEDILNAHSYVYTFFFALFSISIAIGSGFTNRLLKSEITLKYTPLGIIIISLCFLGIGAYLPVFDVQYAIPDSSITAVVGSDQIISLSTFLLTPIYWPLIVLLFLMGLAVGPYITPIYAIIQHDADDDHKGSTIAASNILNSLFIVLSAFLVLFLRDFQNFSIAQICVVAAFINIISLYHIRLMRYKSH